MKLTYKTFCLIDFSFVLVYPPFGTKKYFLTPGIEPYLETQMKVVGSHPLTDRDALPEEVLDVAGHVERRLRVQGVDRGFPQRFAVFLFQICDGHVDRSKLNHINDFVGPKIHGLCQFVTGISQICEPHPALILVGLNRSGS